MPSKYRAYRQMADTAERQLTSSYKSWTQFLRTAAQLYKYPYNEQVMADTVLQSAEGTC